MNKNHRSMICLPCCTDSFSKEKNLAEKGCCHTHIVIALTTPTCNVNLTTKGFKCSPLTSISLNF